MVDDIEYQADMTVYLSKKKRYDDQELELEELDTKGYNLVLEHCPPELTAKLNNINSWPGTEDKQSVVMLLKMIHNIAHNMKRRNQSLMSTVENDSELYPKYQELTQSSNKFYNVFNATINTINDYGGQAGYHPQVYKNHLVASKDKDGITVKSLTAIDTDDRLALKQ